MNPAKSALSALVLLSATSTYAQWSLDPLWALAPGDRSYLPATGDNNQRGLGYNPVTGHLLLTDRTGGNIVHVLNAATGADLGTLDTTGIIASGAGNGTFAINMLRVADDGAIYAANLTTDSSAASTSFNGPLRVYRWANESSAPALVFQGDPSNGELATVSPSNRRYGDNLDVRGSGTSTQILLGSRNGTVAALLTTADGVNFTNTKITNPDGTVAAGMGIAVSFGVGNTFYGDVTGAPTRQFSFDPAAGTITTGLTYTIPNGVAPMGFDPANNLIAGVSLNATPTLDTLVLYDVSTGTAVLQDTKNFPLDKANGNGVGSVEFANGNVYALDVNNGILAFRVVPEPSTYALVGIGGIVLGMVSRRRR